MTDFYSRTHEDLPAHYDADLGPVIFTPYAVDIARRAAADSPARVLETACGTGIVTRALLDALPPGTPLTATDLNSELLANARRKCRPNEAVSFQPADPTALPFPDGSFDTLVCQFGPAGRQAADLHRCRAGAARRGLLAWVATPSNRE